MSDREFDELFRKKVSEKSFTFKESYWQGAEALLDEAANKGRRKRFFFIFLSFVGLLGISGGGTFWLYQNSGLSGGETVLVTEQNSAEQLKVSETGVLSDQGLTAPSEGNGHAIYTSAEALKETKAERSPERAYAMSFGENPTAEASKQLASSAGHDNEPSERGLSSSEQKKFASNSESAQKSNGINSAENSMNRLSSDPQNQLKTESASTDPSASEVNGNLRGESPATARGEANAGDMAVGSKNRTKAELETNAPSDLIAETEESSPLEINKSEGEHPNQASASEKEGLKNGQENAEALVAKSKAPEKGTKEEQANSNESSEQGMGSVAGEQRTNSKEGSSGLVRNTASEKGATKNALAKDALGSDTREALSAEKESTSSEASVESSQKSSFAKLLKNTSSNFASGLILTAGIHGLNDWKANPSGLAFGPSLGIISLSDIGARWSFETGLIYFRRSGAGSESISSIIEFDFGFQEVTSTYETRSLNYFEIPFRLGYYLDLDRRHLLELGASFIQVASANNHITTVRESSLEGPEQSQSNDLFKANGYASQDIAISALYSFRFNNKLGLGLEARYGMNDNTDDSFFLSSGVDRNSGLIFSIRYSPFNK